MPTLQSIAELAGCSAATVSRVLRNRQGVRSETKARVLNAELQLRQSEAPGPVDVVGVLVPELDNPFFMQIVQGIEQEAERHGYELLLCNLSRSKSAAEHYIRFLHERCVKQIVLAGGGVISPSFHQLWSSLLAGANVVSIGQHGLDCPTVTVDDVQGGIQAVNHLVDLGHQAIAMVCGPSNSVPALQRLEGYMSAIFAHHLPYVSDRIIEGDYTVAGGLEAAKRLLAQSTLPSAVFCCNDLMALGLIHGLAAAGLRVPTDISVVGYDGLELLKYTRPRLTSVEVPMAELGQQAASVLLNNRPGTPSTTIVLPTRLRLGETTAALT